MIAECEAALARARTREGRAVAKAKGRLRHTTLDLAETFDVVRSTAYGAIERAGASAPPQRQTGAQPDVAPAT